jgi:biotin carboxylase
MKKVLILGAGVYQTPLIRKAKEMGLFTLVASTAGKYPGFLLADKPYFIDTTDTHGIVRLAQEENIDCVCTTGTDVAVRSLGAVCDALHLPGITEISGRLATNKQEMKRRFESGGVCTARFREVESLEQLRAVFDQFAKPVICKAVDMSGSRGIIRVDAADQLSDAYEYVMGATQKRSFIIEEFISGVEFGAQAAIYDGEVQFIMPHGDIVFHGKTDVPIGHYVPYTLPESVETEARRQVELSVKALGLTTCAINVDFILRDNQIFVLEIGARGGATCLPELVSIYYDIDFYAYILELSLGMKPRVDFLPQHPCGNLLITSAQGGVLERIDVDNTELDIVETVFDYHPGDSVPEFHVGPDRLGHVVLRAADEATVCNDLKKLESKIKIRLKEN